MNQSNASKMANDTPKSTKSGTQQLGAVAGFQTASKVL
jgi:hypothetical protein